MATITTTKGTERAVGWERLAGVGAIGFAALVAGANLISGQTPDWDASGEEVAKWVHDHHTASVISTAGFGLTAVLLLFFLAGFVARVRRAHDDQAFAPAMLGAFSGVLIGAMFSVVVVARLVLLSFDGNSLDPTLTSLLWHFEAAAFMVNVVAVGTALFGVAWAATRIGLAPAWYRPLSAVGLVAAVVAAVQAPSSMNGSPGWQVGFLPFLCWLLLLVIVGTRMVREG